MFANSFLHASRTPFVMAAAGLFLSQTVGFAQTILNIDGRGENHALNPVLVTLSAGRYQVDVIGTVQGGSYDAYSEWSGTSCSNPGGCPVTDPTTETGWYTAYLVVSQNISSVSVAGQQVAPGPDMDNDDFLHDFFYRSSSATRYAAFDGLLFPDASFALSHGRSSTFVLDAAGPVGFALREGPGSFSDNLGGLSLLITRLSESTGDYNHNGNVDAADYTVWRDGLGTTYTQADYDVWKSHFGTHAGSGLGGAAGVPEPTAAFLVAASIVTFAVTFRGRSKKFAVVDRYAAQRGRG